jgi:hypothetical protein
MNHSSLLVERAIIFFLHPRLCCPFNNNLFGPGNFLILRYVMRLLSHGDTFNPRFKKKTDEDLRLTKENICSAENPFASTHCFYR